MPIRKDDEVQVVRGHYKGQQVPRGIAWDNGGRGIKCFINTMMALS